MNMTAMSINTKCKDFYEHVPVFQIMWDREDIILGVDVFRVAVLNLNADVVRS